MDHNDLYFCGVFQAEPLLALLGRMLWLVIGPLVLIVLTVLIVISGSGWLTSDDLAFFPTLALMILGRWIEIRSGYGRTVLQSRHHRSTSAATSPFFVPCASCSGQPPTSSAIICCICSDAAARYDSARLKGAHAAAATDSPSARRFVR